MWKIKLNENWYKKVAKMIIDWLWNLEKYTIKDSENISAIFLAGAPWSWKTEFLESILDELVENFVVIDLDKYRNLFVWYNWENASDYQKACVKVADKVLSYCFKNNLNFIFDGTFRSYNKVQQNFLQCQKYSRKSLISLIFQDPRISFYYTFLRKINKKRNVPIEIFIDGFYWSIENVFKIKKTFPKTELMIAHKKYNLRSKKNFSYKIDYQTSNIYAFCKKYKLWYQKWSFINRDILQFDISKFNDTLTQAFSSKNTTLKRVWCKVKLKITEVILNIK